MGSTTGYHNVDGAEGKRIIVPDLDASFVITKLFERFATGRYSLKALVKELNDEGLKLRGRRLYSSAVHQILRKRLYTGDFDWDGTTYTGTYEPLVTHEIWQRVQELLNARAQNKTRKVKHDFAYSGLIQCGRCGCRFVGELKKGKYVYYHCTGNRGKCPEPYTRQEVLTSEFANVLQELVIPQAILEWLGEAVLAADQTEQAARAQAIRKLQARCDQIEGRVERMYLDKLDGRISQEFFDNQSAAWRREQDGLQRKIQDIQKATPAPIDQAVDMLRLTSRASGLFLKQPAAEQRRLLQVVLEKAAWQDGELRTTLFEPFEILRHSNRESYRKEKENRGSGRVLDIWLPGMDSNHELDKILKARKLLILTSRRCRQKRQKQGLGTKSVQEVLPQISRASRFNRFGETFASPGLGRMASDLSIPIHKSGSLSGLLENGTASGVFFS
jgi:hypothetical protein